MYIRTLLYTIHICTRLHKNIVNMACNIRRVFLCVRLGDSDEPSVPILITVWFIIIGLLVFIQFVLSGIIKHRMKSVYVLYYIFKLKFQYHCPTQ